MGDMIQSLYKKKQYEIICLSFTHKVCYQLTRGNQTGLRKSGLYKPSLSCYFTGACRKVASAVVLELNEAHPPRFVGSGIHLFLPTPYF